MKLREWILKKEFLKCKKIYRSECQKACFWGVPKSFNNSGFWKRLFQCYVATSQESKKVFHISYLPSPPQKAVYAYALLSWVAKNVLRPNKNEWKIAAAATFTTPHGWTERDNESSNRGGILLGIPKMVLPRPLFCFIFVLFSHNSNINWKKRSWCAWDSN